MTSPAMIKKEVTDEANALIVKIFGGRDEFGASDKKYEDAITHIKKFNLVEMIAVLNACVLFFEKPTKYLLLGVTKNVKMSSGAMNAVVSKFLPHHDQSWYPSLARSKDPNDQRAFVKRQDWPEAFKSLNISLIRTISLMAIEASFNTNANIGHVIETFKKKYPHAPSSANLFGVGFKNEETKKIRLEALQQFQSEQELWQKHVEELCGIIMKN